MMNQRRQSRQLRHNFQLPNGHNYQLPKKVFTQRNTILVQGELYYIQIKILSKNVIKIHIISLEAGRRGPIHNFNGHDANFYISTGQGVCSVNNEQNATKDANYFCKSFYSTKFKSVSYVRGKYAASGEMGWQMHKARADKIKMGIQFVIY